MPFSDALEDSRILIVEDCEANCRYFRRLLAQMGFSHVVAIQDPRQALDTFISLAPDLVILDLHMPHLDGFQVMEQLKPHVLENTFLPILVITGDLEPSVRIRCLSAGAKDFVAKPFRADELALRIRNLLETRHLHQFLAKRTATLELKVMEEHSRLRATQLEILRRLAVAAEYRDDVTGRHAERVGLLAAQIGNELGLPDDEVGFLAEAGPLHDVGKIGIPDSILLKPGKLTDEDFETIKTHTTIGGVILSRDSFPLLGYAREIAVSHHERWDGSGYPNGLAGESIPLSGRIVAIADVFDSIVHERSYKPAYPVEEAVSIMIDARGRHFDAALLDHFVQLVETGRVQEILAGGNASDALDSRASRWSKSAVRAPVDRAPAVPAVAVGAN